MICYINSLGIRALAYWISLDLVNTHIGRLGVFVMFILDLTMYYILSWTTVASVQYGTDLIVEHYNLTSTAAINPQTVILQQGNQISPGSSDTVLPHYFPMYLLPLYWIYPGPPTRSPE